MCSTSAPSPPFAPCQRVCMWAAWRGVAWRGGVTAWLAALTTKDGRALLHHEVVAGQHVIGRQAVEAELDRHDLVETVETLALALVRPPLLAARHGARRRSVRERPVVRAHKLWNMDKMRKRRENKREEEHGQNERRRNKKKGRKNQISNETSTPNARSQPFVEAIAAELQFLCFARCVAVAVVTDHDGSFSNVRFRPS